MDIQSLRIPNFFAEVLKTIVGLVFLFTLNLLYSPALEMIPNLKYFNETTILVFIGIIAYFLGRLFIVIANIWNDLVCLLFSTKRVEVLKENFKLFLSIVNSHEVPILKKNDRNYAIDEFISTKKFLREYYEKSYHSRHFIGLLIGSLILLSFFLNTVDSCIKLWTVVTVLTVMGIIDNNDQNRERLKIARYMESAKT